MNYPAPVCLILPLEPGHPLCTSLPAGTESITLHTEGLYENDDFTND